MVDSAPKLTVQRLYGLPAPAKLNLSLQVTGRRDDGYHTLRSEMQLIELADWIDLERRDDGEIVREGELTGPLDQDLALRAARALRQATGTPWGATIRILKTIPVGSGLGGGSSDAATTLIGLNRLWALQLERPQLAELAVGLGADVPFFLFGRNAVAEGIGEVLTLRPATASHYAVAWPQVAVSTREIFEGLRLTVPGEATKMAGFPANESAAHAAITTAAVTNDLQPVAVSRVPVIGQAIERLQPFGDARMTGSGSAVFVEAASAADAEAAVAALPAAWGRWAVRGLDEHPLLPW